MCPSSGVFNNCFGSWQDDGHKYVGEFKDDLFNGQGTYTYPSGREYNGQFSGGNFSGIGTMSWPDGTKYVGEFKDDKFNGQGTFTYPDGTKYVGEFKDDLFNGQGTYTQPDGTKYVGEFKDDKFTGQGTYTYPDGTKYVGEFKDDLFNGQGTYTEPDGAISEGVWFDDELVQEKPIGTINVDIGENVSDVPEKKDILNAVYGSTALKRLFTVDILTMDGFFQSDTIYTAKVQYEIQEIQQPEFIREIIFRDYFMENGMTKSEATSNARMMSVLSDFSSMTSGFVGALSGVEFGKYETRRLTEIFRFGKGNKQWIYLPESEPVGASNETYYETDLQGWVKKHADF